MKQKVKQLFGWVFWTFIAFVVILTGSFLYTIWSSLVRLGADALATIVVMMVFSHLVIVWIAFRLGRSDAFNFIRGFDTGTERTVDVLQKTKVATSRAQPVQLEPVRRPVQIVPRQLMSGAEEGEIIDL